MRNRKILLYFGAMRRIHYTQISTQLAHLLAVVLLLSLAGQQLLRVDVWVEKVEVELELNLESDAETSEEGKWEDPCTPLAHERFHALSRLHSGLSSAAELRSVHPEHPCQEVHTPPPGQLS